MTTTTASINATTTSPVWRDGVKAGLVAAAATTGFAIAAHAAGVSFEIQGEAIPWLGFAQLTFACSLIGVAIAAVLRRRSDHARTTFLRTTVALTALSVVPDLTINAETATKCALIATHLIAASIVIPALARRLQD